MVQCETCKFWTNSQKSPSSNDMVGECRRFPRVSVLLTDDEESKWFYPLHFSFDFCGEHILR